MTSDIDADSLTSLWIIPNRLKCASERGFEDHVQDDKAHEKNRQDKIVRARQGRHQWGHGNAVKAVVPPCEAIPPEDDCPNERTQRNLEHTKIEPGQSDTKPADEEADYRCRERRDHEGDP